MDEKLAENRLPANAICRLCTNTLILEYAVSIFENKDNGLDIHELLAKYLQLELSSDDPISTLICQDCFDHLEDFHSFYKKVEHKQKLLENQQRFDFLEVKCESLEVNDIDKKDEVPAQDILCETLIAEQDDFLTVNEGIKTEETDYSSDDDTPLNELCNIPNFKRKLVDSSTDEEKIDKPKHKTKSKKKKKLNDSEEKPKLQPSAQSIVLDDCDLSCELCQSVIGNYSELSKHFQKTHKFKAVFIKCCGKKYSARKTIARHMHRHRDPDKFKCPFCDKQLASTTYLKFHIESKHDPEKNGPLKCNICDKEFTLRKCFRKHMRYHENNVIKEKKPANCDQCSRSFSSELRLKQHRKIMHGIVLPYQCDACAESFLTKEEEEKHQSVCKNRKLASKASTGICKKKEPTEEDLICKICCKLFPSTYGLRAHIASIHENIHNFICDQCGKKFKLKASFEKHQLIHQGIVEPPAQCETCGKWLKSQSSLRVHQYIHDNSFNKCSICEHVSTTRRALKLHVKKVHRTEHNFHCQYCEKSFKTSTYLEEHMAIHTGAQLYACPYCLKESRSKSNMYAHVKRMHPEEWLKKQLARTHNPNPPQSHLIKL